MTDKRFETALRDLMAAYAACNGEDHPAYERAEKLLAGKYVSFPAPQEHLRVSPLVWRTLDNGDAWSTMTPVGLMYHASQHGWRHRNGSLNPTNGIEAAKAAAQEDYVNRILAALTTEGQP